MKLAKYDPLRLNITEKKEFRKAPQIPFIEVGNKKRYQYKLVKDEIAAWVKEQNVIGGRSIYDIARNDFKLSQPQAFTRMLKDFGIEYKIEDKRRRFSPDKARRMQMATIRLTVKGMSAASIARELGINPDTVARYQRQNADRINEIREQAAKQV